MVSASLTPSTLVVMTPSPMNPRICVKVTPAMTTYRYHNVPSCLLNAATGLSSVVGWMADGFPIVVERDATGALPTNADLDKCHGRVSPILLNGKIVTQYHYSATLEFPYSIGCSKGTPKILR
jgi:hypothetical protein